MKKLNAGLPRSLFPFRSVSQRLNLEYDEIDEIMDELFHEIFENVPEAVPILDEPTLEQTAA